MHYYSLCGDKETEAQKFKNLPIHREEGTTRILIQNEFFLQSFMLMIWLKFSYKSVYLRKLCMPSKVKVRCGQSTK